MFRNKTAEILNSNREKVSEVKISMQPLVSTKRYFDRGVTIELAYKSYCDVDDNINIDAYFRVDNIEYKIIDMKKYEYHIMCTLYQCGVK